MHSFTIHRSIYLKDTPFLTLKYLARLVILMLLMTMMAVEGGYVRVAGVRIWIASQPSLPNTIKRLTHRTSSLPTQDDNADHNNHYWPKNWISICIFLKLILSLSNVFFMFVSIWQSFAWIHSRGKKWASGNLCKETLIADCLGFAQQLCHNPHLTLTALLGLRWNILHWDVVSQGAELCWTCSLLRAVNGIVIVNELYLEAQWALPICALAPCIASDTALYFGTDCTLHCELILVLQCL